MSDDKQFEGLDMKQLIGVPLAAAAHASVQLAQSTADFINKVGFDEQKKIKNVQFENIEGTISHDNGNVNDPLLTIVPIPNSQIDEVDISFDMDVKGSQKSESLTNCTRKNHQ